MTNFNVTRGSGFLEGFLAEKRSGLADSLIPSGLRSGRILDIGCGSFPLFLVNTIFFEKYGLDRLIPEECVSEFHGKGINLLSHDVDSGVLPFTDEYFDVVTMLAVFEHIEPEKLGSLLKEIHRVLKLGGGVCPDNSCSLDGYSS